MHRHVSEQHLDGYLLSRGRGHHIHGHLLSLSLIASVLEPDFHLLFGELEGRGQVGSLWSGEVPLVSESPLQLEDLCVGERCPRALLASLLL